MDDSKKMVKCRIVILTGDVINRYDLGRFVVDLETIRLHKNRIEVDYDHDQQIGLGYCENIRYEPGIGLIGDGYLSSPNTNDKAYEVLERLTDGFPYEISPTLDLEPLDGAEVYHLEEGEKAIVNGREVEGELDIYRNVGLRGVGIVHFATDPNTYCVCLKNSKNLCTLSFHGDLNMKKTKKNLNDEALVKLANEEEVIEEVIEEPKPEYLVLLEQMIEEFGLDNAITYFRQGLDLDQARIADYEELKKRRKELMGGNGGGEEAETGTEGEGEGGEGGGGEETTPEVTGDDSETTTTETTTTTNEGEGNGGDGDKTETDGNLKAEITALKDELARLKAVFGNRGEDKPISNTVNEDNPMKKMSAVEKMAEKIKRVGIKKA